MLTKPRKVRRIRRNPKFTAFGKKCYCNKQSVGQIVELPFLEVNCVDNVSKFDQQICPFCLEVQEMTLWVFGLRKTKVVRHLKLEGHSVTPSMRKDRWIDIYNHYV